MLPFRILGRVGVGYVQEGVHLSSSLQTNFEEFTERSNDERRGRAEGGPREAEGGMTTGERLKIRRS